MHESTKKYYDKLFKEYAICELKYYKEGKIALRWRTEKEGPPAERTGRRNQCYYYIAELYGEQKTIYDSAG